MSNELAFALINPYTISKSRTGGVLGRFISRTGLELVAARMFGPSRELVDRYAELVECVNGPDTEENRLLAKYVRDAYAPDPLTGRPRRVMMLLFEGEDAIARIARVTGQMKYSLESAETVRGTYGDYIVDEQGVRYVEPAVMIGTSPESVRRALRLWAEYSERDGGLIASAADVADADESEQTLVIIKPDNFRFPSARPGNIIDIFSRSGLRIIAAKVHRMSVAEAEEFYGPVREVLRNKLKANVAERVGKVLAAELGFELTPEMKQTLGEQIGPLYGDHQFYQIVQFMTGQAACTYYTCDRTKPGTERCLALIYAGHDAVSKIRNILGPTDPSKAEPGSVRREFGQDIMVNAAHASDSTANAEREMRIIRVEEDTVRMWVDTYYPA